MKIITTIISHPRVKQISWLYSAMAISLLLGVANSVVTARILEPAAFGDYRYVLSVFQLMSGVLFFGVYVSGSRLLAITNNDDLARGIKGALILSMVFLSISLTTVSIIYSFFEKDYNSEYLSSFFILLSPLLFGYHLKALVETSFQGENRIIELSFFRIMPQFFFLASIILLYVSNLEINAQWAITIQLLGICIVGLFFATRLQVSFSLPKLQEGFRRLWRETKTYGYHVYSGSLFNVSGGYIAPIIISYISADNVDVGFYTLALTLTTPLALLPSIVGTVYFKQFASIPRMPGKLISYTLIMSGVSLIIFVIGIEPLINLLYTEKYNIAAGYARWLALGSILHGIGDIYNRFLGSKGKGKSIRNAAVGTGIVIILGNIFIVTRLGALGATATKIFSDVTYLGLMIFYYLKYLRS